MKNIQESICQAHMAGQMAEGCKHPSWSDAVAYFKSIEDQVKKLKHHCYCGNNSGHISVYCDNCNPNEFM